MALRTTGCLVLLVLGLAAPVAAQQAPTSAPPVAAVQTTPPPPPARSGRMSPLATAGLTMFGISYMPSLAIGVGYLVIIYPFQYLISENNPEPALLWLMVPGVGPFFGANTDILRGERGWQAFYVGLGVVQSVGLLLWATALFDNHGATPPPPPQAGLRIAPGNGGPALTLSW